MYKVGVCGFFGDGFKTYNGQTIKTITITTELDEFFGKDNVKRVDTYNWKKNFFILLFKCYNLSRMCENIIILPAQNGIKAFPILFLLTNKLFHRRLHYIVIGGWLPDLLENNSKLRNRVSKFDGIYVETKSMARVLTNMGLNNIRYLPNFKHLEIISESELVYSKDEPYKLCTFSRVMKEKGIEEAIEAVKRINAHKGRVAFTLDIFGQIDDQYKEEFEGIKRRFPGFISYEGIVEANNSVKTLKEYDALLFPTYYEGEGFAGTILDAFASGVPVIATNWKYNSEIIQDRSDGFIYDYKKPFELDSVLDEMLTNKATIISMKKKSLQRARQYLPEVIIQELIQYL